MNCVIVIFVKPFEDILVMSKPSFTVCSLQKTEKNENCEESDAQVQSQTPPVKLRRPSTSEGPRPSSTPPVIAASGMKEDEDEEEKIMAELEVTYG